MQSFNFTGILIEIKVKNNNTLNFTTLKEFYMKRFYVCRKCGNLFGLIHDSGVPVKCCGQNMEVLIPNKSDGAEEKHVPVAEIKNDAVYIKIGDVPHPMIEQHFIEWIYLETQKGGQRKALQPGEAPEVVFYIGDDKPVAVYEYCNIHGLWKKDIK